MWIVNYIKKQMETLPISEQDRLLVEIITKMCEDEETEFRTEYDQDRYFGYNERLQYYVVVTDDYIKITNHDFYLSKYGHIKQMSNLIKLIRNRIHDDRDRFESEIFKNEVELLEKISLNLSTSNNT